MPDEERRSGLGDRSHGGELPKRGGLDRVEENYKPIATGPNAFSATRIKAERLIELLRT
jgi:hypothetical protein